MRFARAASLTVFALALAGCESDSTAPVVDVDATLSQMATGGISTYTTAAAGSVAGGVNVPVPDSHASACGYDAPTSFFICAPVTTNGLTFSRRFQLLDASSAPLSTANPLAVAAIRSVIDIEGTMTQGSPNPVTLQIDRHEDATLSGIQSTNRVLNGSATQQMTLTTSNLTVVSDETSSTTNLLLPSTPQQKYPLGGKILTTGTSTLSGSVSGTQNYSREITFDGTSVMTIKLTSGGLTTTCLVNLESPGTPPSCG